MIIRYLKIFFGLKNIISKKKINQKDLLILYIFARRKHSVSKKLIKNLWKFHFL